MTCVSLYEVSVWLALHLPVVFDLFVCSASVGPVCTSFQLGWRTIGTVKGYRPLRLGLGLRGFV
jgi:hypothetical protein